MKPTASPSLPDQNDQEEALAARRAAWRTASALLLALSMLNLVILPFVDGTIDNTFVLTNGINLILAAGLWALQPWARYLAIVRALLAIGLSVVVAAQSGAIIDAAIGVLFMVGIALPILGPPRGVKNALGVGLFLLGLIGTSLALVGGLIG